jgi:hypothetical protein
VPRYQTRRRRRRQHATAVTRARHERRAQRVGEARAEARAVASRTWSCQRPPLPQTPMPIASRNPLYRLPTQAASRATVRSSRPASREAPLGRRASTKHTCAAVRVWWRPAPNRSRGPVRPARRRCRRRRAQPERSRRICSLPLIDSHTSCHCRRCSSGSPMRWRPARRLSESLP